MLLVLIESADPVVQTSDMQLTKIKQQNKMKSNKMDSHSYAQLTDGPRLAGYHRISHGVRYL